MLSGEILAQLIDIRIPLIWTWHYITKFQLKMDEESPCVDYLVNLRFLFKRNTPVPHL